MLWARGSPKLSAAVCLQDLNFLRKITKWGRPPCLSYALSSLKRAGHALVMSAPKKVGGGVASDCPALWELALWELALWELAVWELALWAIARRGFVGACVYWDKYILFLVFLPLRFS
jgi:hypothetical protein